MKPRNTPGTRASAQARSSQAYFVTGDLPGGERVAGRSGSRGYTRTVTWPNGEKKRFFTSAKVAAILILALVIVVGVSVWAHYYFSDKTTVERELPRAAKEYYEDYYYDKLIDTMGGKVDVEVFAKYAERGLPETRLRQILNYADGKNSGLAKPVKALGCDTNRSYVTFRPVTPYGRENYTVRYDLQCTTEVTIAGQEES